MIERFAGEVRAPELPAGLEWINAARPVTLRELRGKLVLLDFWTAGCINCLHTLPQLRELERRFAEGLVVIGVHSAKFPAEQATAALRQAVRRYGVRHPVVNDGELRVWREYAVRAWPTLMLVDPRGRVVGRHEGEFEAQRLAPEIEALLAEYGAAGWLTPGVPDFGGRGAGGGGGGEGDAGGGALAFPGKLLADTRGRGHITIADSSHHRLVVMGLAVRDGAVHHLVGSGGDGGAGGPGRPGFVDGPPDVARFNWPQGLAMDDRTGVIYVADTENHAVRRLSPAGGEVTTIAGTGRQARRALPPGTEAPAREVDLSSPWDLAFLPRPRAGPLPEPGSHEDPHDDDGLLFIAMAGTHQIWVLDLASGVVGPFAGTGREALVDGPRAEAGFAQPSGLALDVAGRRLYVADSEASAVRRVDLGTGAVSTLVGAGLFAFGDVDGAPDVARLQHPLGVALWPEDPQGASLLVADTYNHRIKRIDLGDGSVRTLVGAGPPPGDADGPGAGARFSEPGGLTLARGVLFVADTNNHRVREVDLATGAVGTLEVDLSRRAH